jgi:cold shock CspA family protein/uncharacterized LabA/DUF88 family protein
MGSSKLTDLIRIGIFYDGYYFYKVSNYYKYEHAKKARISISGLHDFVRNEVASISGTDIKQCQIVDAHYFRGRSTARELGDKVQNERIFEEILMRENIVTHYLPLRMGENNVLQEKGIDVWLALEAYELAMYKRFDILVLVACDGDYVPLVRKLNILGTHVMLISWDFTYHNENGYSEQTKTSRQLLEEVYHPVFMHQAIDSNGQNEFIRNLFVDDKYSDSARNAANSAPQKREFVDSGNDGAKVNGNNANGNTGDEDNLNDNIGNTINIQGNGKEYVTSTIQSVKDGYGFIEDRQTNNVFFHYSIVENRDFNELKPGLQVRYLREEDEERSKREGGPRYRAIKVTVVD